MREPPQDSPYFPPEPGAAPSGTPKKSMGAGSIACLVVLGVAALVFIGAAVFSVVAFRRFEAAAKSAQVRNTVAAIARAQVDAYRANGMLCGAAAPVPAKIPAGSKYQPSALPGEDFQKGSKADGWPCLKFSETSPIHHQYELRVRGGYKGVARGGPDPGPDGFEVSAEGDLDGDGKTSLFVMVGRVDVAAHTVELKLPLFVADEME